MLRVRRGLTWGLVAVVAGSGLAGLEAWPLTGWRLFTARRHPVVTRYEARVVRADGFEALVPFDDLPHSFSGARPVLVRMARQRPEQRDAACGAWAEASSRVLQTVVTEVRVYEVADDLRDGSSRSALAWTCGRHGP